MFLTSGNSSRQETTYFIVSFIACGFPDMTDFYTSRLLKFKSKRKSMGDGGVGNSYCAHSLYDFTFRAFEHLLRRKSGGIASQNDHRLIILGVF